jgi:N-acetyl-anhydromuramyl-L-alanine amidase AmpD
MGWLDKLISAFAPKSTTTKTIVDATPNVSSINPLDLNTVTFEKSPNQSDRNDVVRAIVFHHTGPGTFNGTVSWLKNPLSKVSAHYVLGTSGELKQLVNTTKKAWHAGPSTWTIDGVKRIDLNNCTIGIEIQNVGRLVEKDGKYYLEDGTEWKGTGTPVKKSVVYPSGKVIEGMSIEYPSVQTDKLISLCKALIVKYPAIGKEDILTHALIATPEGRKPDPFGLDVQDLIKRIFE